MERLQLLSMIVFVHIGMIEGILPIGIAFKMPDSSVYCFYINPRLFCEYTGYVYGRAEMGCISNLYIPTSFEILDFIGMLVASMVGVDVRATMDIDTMIKVLPLNEIDAERIISEICEIEVDDGVQFRVTSITTIMEEFEYPGIRMMLEATLDRMRQPIKLDISTDDVITPTAIEYEYKLMFEDEMKVI